MSFHIFSFRLLSLYASLRKNNIFVTDLLIICAINCKKHLLFFWLFHPDATDVLVSVPQKDVLNEIR